MYIENPIYFKRNLLLYGGITAALQAGLFSLFPLIPLAGNFDFLVYILFVLFSVLIWIFLFWRNVEIARSFSLRIAEGIITLHRGFIVKETQVFAASQISRLLVKGKGEFADITLFLNCRKIVALRQPVYVLQAILAELTEKGETL